MRDLDLSNLSEADLRHIVAEGQSYLEGQMGLAVAADQRASSLAGVFTAGGTALIAGLIALASISAKGHLYPLYAGGGFAALFFLIAASLCIFATFPAKMWLAGCDPQTWYADIKQKKAFKDSLGEVAGHIHDKILDNNAVIERNATLFKWGSAIGILSPLIGVLVWVLTSSVYWLAA